MGVLMWFQPLVVQWSREEVAAVDVADFLLTGSEAGGQFDQSTGGSYRVGDARGVATDAAGFEWNPEWSLIAVRSFETGARVLLDGNKRAVALSTAVAQAVLPRDTPIQVITGEVHPSIILASKALSSLWRERLAPT